MIGRCHRAILSARASIAITMYVTLVTYTTGALTGPPEVPMSFFSGLGSSLVDFGSGLINMNMQRREQRFQHDFAMNAASIRAHDLQRAGLSKTLAAGSAASMPTPISPRMDKPDLLGHRLAAAQVGKTQAEKDLAQSMKDQKDIENAHLGGIMYETEMEKRIANEYAKATLDMRIESTDSARKSAAHRVNMDYYHAIAAEVAPELAKAELSKTQADALLKQATKAVQDVLKQEKKWNLKWFQSAGTEKGYPTTMGFDPTTRLIHMAVQGILTLLEKSRETPQARRDQERKDLEGIKLPSTPPRKDDVLGRAQR